MGKKKKKSTGNAHTQTGDPARALPPRARRWCTRATCVHLSILLLAVLIRLYFVVPVDWYARSDTRDFHEYALNLLSGKGFVVYWNEAPVREGFVSRQVHSVGYPLFLAGLYAVTGFDQDVYARSYMATMRSGAHPLPPQGFNPFHALLANVFLDIITMCALIVIARHYFGFGTAVLVQILYAVYVSWTPQLITETLFICLFTSSIACMVRSRDFERIWPTVAFSLTAVLAVMTKPIAIVLYAFVGLWVLRRFSWRRIARAALIGLPLVLFVAVMFWRSHHYYGQMFLSSTGAQHVITANYGYSWWDEHVRLWESLGRAPNEAEWMNHFKALKRKADREDPVRAIRVYGESFRQMFTWEPDWHLHWLWQANYHRYPEVAQLHRAFFRLSLLWYPLGILGLLVFGRRAPIPAGSIVFFLLLHAAVSLGNHRYMAPVNVLFMLFAGALLFRAGQWIRIRLRPEDDDNPREPASSPASNTAQ